MIIEELITHLPNFSAVIGERWLCQKCDWGEDFISDCLPWYEQLENDIGILKGHLNIQKIASCYRASLRDQSQTEEAIFEIHGAAFFSSVATEIDLHVPRGDGSGSNFDIWAKVKGYSINAECKTRTDQPLLKFPAEPDPESGLPVYVADRETMDPHDANDLGIELARPVDVLHHIAIPESTVIRQILLEGLGQLPSTGYNLFIFGHRRGDRRNLERALYGTEFAQRQMDPKTKRVTFPLKLAPTGAFDRGPAGEPFKGLNGVLWVRLMPLWLGDNSIGRAYKLYLNPCSTPLPNEVTESLNVVIDHWTTMKEEKSEESNE